MLRVALFIQRHRTSQAGFPYHVPRIIVHLDKIIKAACDVFPVHLEGKIPQRALACSSTRDQHILQPSRHPSFQSHIVIKNLHHLGTRLEGIWAHCWNLDPLQSFLSICFSLHFHHPLYLTALWWATMSDVSRLLQTSAAAGVLGLWDPNGGGEQASPGPQIFRRAASSRGVNASSGISPLGWRGRGLEAPKTFPPHHSSSSTSIFTCLSCVPSHACMTPQQWEVHSQTTEAHLIAYQRQSRWKAQIPIQRPTGGLIPGAVSAGKYFSHIQSSSL